MTTNELTDVLNAVLHNHSENGFGISEVIAAIAALIALGALVVAHFARKDSKRSADAAQDATRLMGEQLKLAINERDRKLQNEVNESRPFFRWRGGLMPSGGLVFQRDFENVGGEVRNLEITTGKNGISASISHMTFLGHNECGWVKFTSSKEPIKSFYFAITCTTKLEEICEMKFKATIGQSAMLINLESTN